MTAGVTPAEFSTLMAGCGPLGGRPRLAVAVSGGADSLALALLAHDWARSQGGEAVALTVDHGLRAASAEEARAVGKWLGKAGLRHHTLKWNGPHPKTRVQEAARIARYDLLTQWCRANNVMYLLLAHHRDDQAETYFMRKERGSGPAGLAAMRAVTPPPGGGYRWPLLVRPLLPVGKHALEGTLVARGQDWIRDPSNENADYERVRVRRQIQGAPDPDALTARLVKEAADHARIRDRIDRDLCALYARSLTLSPHGFVRVSGVQDIPEGLVRDFWFRLLRTVGGRAYPPRGDRMETFIRKLGQGDFKGATLAGCYVLSAQSGLLVMREAAGIQDDVPLSPELVWDRRFLIRSSLAPGYADDYRVRRLGEDGVRALMRDWPEARQWSVPAKVRRTLPGIFKNGALQGLPVFEDAPGISASLKGVRAQFVPPTPLIW